MVLIIPCLTIHYISYKSLTKQGRLLYEFNNNSFKMSLNDLNEISDAIKICKKYQNKIAVLKELDKAHTDGIISKNYRDRNKSRISKL